MLRERLNRKYWCENISSIIIILMVFAIEGICASSTQVLSLNGPWQAGYERHYNQAVNVPAPFGDSTKASEQSLWYRRTVTLPNGCWKHAALHLKGAAFAPSVYVNGDLVATLKTGGLAPVYVNLNHECVKPGRTVTLEIELQSHSFLDSDDPSYISKADHWRCNMASWIWDDVELFTYGDFRISQVVPFTDLANKKLAVKWRAEAFSADNMEKVVAVIYSLEGEPLVRAEQRPTGNNGEIILNYAGKCLPWSPEKPNLYKLEVSVYANGRISHAKTFRWAPREFKLRKIKKNYTGFELNNEPITLRGAGIVWRRWSRDPESWEVLHDEEWFLDAVLKPLKDRGANYIRWHLYSPPERFLDLCDEYGILVSIESHFFHGFNIDGGELKNQWNLWFDMFTRHPCIAIFQPYNESRSGATKTALDVANDLFKQYPPLLLIHRDIEDVHRYWWSLFENVGLYFDDAHIGDKALMAGEFGGNYLDGNLDVGGYKALRGSFARHLGPDHTHKQRAWLQNVSNGKIAEYWRRIGAPGISAFCLLGSFMDGNHWYRGDLRGSRLKEVWDWMTPTWSARAVSLEMWNRNFVPGDIVEAGLWFFNDTSEPAKLNAQLQIKDSAGAVFLQQNSAATISANSSDKIKVSLKMPEEAGRYRIEAKLLNPTEDVKVPVISRWDVFVSGLRVPPYLKNIKVGVYKGDRELQSFLASCDINTVDLFEDCAAVIVTSRKFWQAFQDSAQVRSGLEAAVERGKSVVMLDVGPQFYGKEYPVDGRAELFNLGFPGSLNEKPKEETFLFRTQLKFTKMTDGQSHIHPTLQGRSLWNNIDQEQTWLFNGMRGGLIVPAVKMNFLGTSDIELWKHYGADVEAIESGEDYYAYELAGNYVFSQKKNDKAAIQKLRDQVKFLAEDAPAIAAVLKSSQVQIINVTQMILRSSQALKNTISLVLAGGELAQSPVLSMMHGDANIIVSQLITHGRLANSQNTINDVYAIVEDVAAQQMVLNMIGYALK